LARGSAKVFDGSRERFQRLDFVGDHSFLDGSSDIVVIPCLIGQMGKAATADRWNLSNDAAQAPICCAKHESVSAAVVLVLDDARLEHYRLPDCQFSERCRTAGAPRQLITDPPHRFGEVRVAILTLLTLTTFSGWQSCGVVIPKFSGQTVTLRSSQTVLADISMSGRLRHESESYEDSLIKLHAQDMQTA
jgi:hypothetical protein